MNFIQTKAQNDAYALIFGHLLLSTARAILGSALVGATGKPEMQLSLLKQPGQSLSIYEKILKRGQKLNQ